MPLTTYAISQVSSPTFAGTQNSVAFITSRKQFAFAQSGNLIWVDINGTIQGSALAVGIGTITSVFYASAIDRVIAFSGSNIASINPSTLAITTNNPGGTGVTFGAYSATSNLILGATGAFDNDPRFWNCSTLTSPGVSSIRSNGIAWASVSNEFLVIRGGSNNISVVDPTTRITVATIDNGSEPSGIVYCGASLNTFYVGNGGGGQGRFYSVPTRGFLSLLSGDAQFSSASMAFDDTTGLFLAVNRTNVNSIIDPQTYRTVSTFTTTPSQTPTRAATGLGVFMVSQGSTICRHFRASYSFASGRIEEDLFTFNFATSTITVLRSEPFFSFCTALDAFPYHGRSLLFETISATDANVNANMILTGTADIPADGTLTFVGARTLTLGTKSSYTLKAAIPAAGIVEVNRDVEIFGLTFVGGATINKASGAPGTITVTVAAVAGITAGAGVVLREPSRATAISGFPTANNANGVAPAPVLGLYNSSFAFIAGFSTNSPEYSAGTFTILLSAYPTCAYVVGDAIGWIRTAYIPVDASNPPAALSVAPAFTQITDETLRPIVGLGNATKKARLNYNQAAGRFELDAGEIDFYSALDRKEDLTSNVAGLQTFETTVVRGIRFVANKYGYEVQLPAPLTAAAAAAAATSPILENFLLLRAGNPTEDPFNHDLSSTAPGLTSRPEVRINNTRFIAATDTDISGLPTRSEFNARTLPSSQYSTLVDETIEALLQAALEGLSTGGLGPDDIARLERIENQLIADTIKGATRYKRLLPGTETVILDKDVTFEPEVGYILTEHQEPPP